MVSSPSQTVPQYLAGLTPEDRRVMAAVRRVVRRHLPPGYRERMHWGMIAYEVPLKRYPDTYNGQPLCYAGLARHKSYFALYLMCAYGNPKVAARFKAAFKRAGKKLDMGKSCVRFRRLEDLSLEAIGEALASTPVDAYVAAAQRSRRR